MIAVACGYRVRYGVERAAMCRAHAIPVSQEEAHEGEGEGEGEIDEAEAAPLLSVSNTAPAPKPEEQHARTLTAPSARAIPSTNGCACYARTHNRFRPAADVCTAVCAAIWPPNRSLTPRSMLPLH